MGVNTIMTTDIHQFLFSEIGVTRHLITGISIGIGGKEHQRLLALIDELHPAAG